MAAQPAMMKRSILAAIENPNSDRAVTENPNSYGEPKRLQRTRMATGNPGSNGELKQAQRTQTATENPRENLNRYRDPK